MLTFSLNIDPIRKLAAHGVCTRPRTELGLRNWGEIALIVANSDEQIRNIDAYAANMSKYAMKSKTGDKEIDYKTTQELDALLMSAGVAANIVNDGQELVEAEELLAEFVMLQQKVDSINIVATIFDAFNSDRNAVRRLRQLVRREDEALELLLDIARNKYAYAYLQSLIDELNGDIAVVDNNDEVVVVLIEDEDEEEIEEDSSRGMEDLVPSAQVVTEDPTVAQQKSDFSVINETLHQETSIVLMVTGNQVKVAPSSRGGNSTELVYDLDKLATAWQITQRCMKEKRVVPCYTDEDLCNKYTLDKVRYIDFCMMSDADQKGLVEERSRTVVWNGVDFLIRSGGRAAGVCEDEDGNLAIRTSYKLLLSVENLGGTLK